jgi:hypothetical protein
VHADKAETALAAVGSSCLWIEARAIILDREHQRPIVLLQRQTQGSSVSVLRDIGQRFLGDAVEAGF